MTIEQILDLPAEDLATISDEQYLKWFTEHGYLSVVRPEQVVRSASGPKQPSVDYAMLKKIEQLKLATGIDASHLLKKKVSWKK